MEDGVFHYCWTAIPNHGSVKLGTDPSSPLVVPWHDVSSADFKRDLGDAFMDTIKALEPTKTGGPASPTRTKDPERGGGPRLERVVTGTAIWKKNKPPPPDILEVLEAAYIDRADVAWVCAAFDGRGVTEGRVSRWLSNKSRRDRVAEERRIREK